MRCSDHTVTYSVIRRAPGDLRDVLPFFSKQSLANAARELQNMARELQNMGYRVRLKKIRSVVMRDEPGERFELMQAAGGSGLRPWRQPLIIGEPEAARQLAGLSER